MLKNINRIELHFVLGRRTKIVVELNIFDIIAYCDFTNNLTDNHRQMNHL